MSRTSIVLVVVALGLLGFIVFFERGSLSTTERELRKGRVIDNFVRERVKRLELQRHGVTTVLVHAPANPEDPLDLGGWQVEAPYQAKADSLEVDSLLGAIEWAEARRSLGAASPEDIKQFGLDAPRYRVSFQAGREEGGFSVGAKTPDGAGAYLKRRGSDEVFVIGRDLLDEIDHEPEDFHIKSLHEGLTVLTTERLSLRGADAQPCKLTHRDGYFWIESPITALASEPEVKAIVDTLDSLRATRYVGDAARPEYGLSEASLALTLDSLVYDPAKKGERTTEHFSLQVGSSCGEHTDEAYVQVGEQEIFCAPTAELEKLQRTAEQLRETRLLPLEDSDIVGVELRDAQRELTLTTDDAGEEKVTRYRLTQGGKELQSAVADPEALTRWYATLRDTHIEGFDSVDAHARAAIERAGLQATFKRSGKDDRSYVLHVDRARRSGVRMDDPSLLKLPESAPALLSPVGARYRARRVLKEDESQLSALVVTRGGGSMERERIERTSTGFELVTPFAAKAARSALDELARLFSQLEALRFEADSARPEHGLASPYRTLRVEYRDAKSGAEPRAHTLVIGNKSGALGRYARLDDDPAVFVLSHAIAAKLEEPLVSPAELSLPVQRVRRIEMSAGKRRLVIEREPGEQADSVGARFVVAGKGAASATLAREVVDTLAGRAERALSYGPDDHAERTPALEASVQLAEPEATVRYRFFEEQEGQDANAVRRVLVRRSDLPVTWLVSEATLDGLQAALTAPASEASKR